jgi:hypothetical protein
MVIHILGYVYGKNVIGKLLKVIMVNYIGSKKSEKK